MLKSANIPTSFALSILVVWIMLDAWIRPLSFTDEVLPKQWSLWLLPVYIVLFSVCWFILRPFYRANRATGHQIALIFSDLSDISYHFFFFLTRIRIVFLLRFTSSRLGCSLASSLRSRVHRSNNGNGFCVTFFMDKPSFSLPMPSSSHLVQSMFRSKTCNGFGSVLCHFHNCTSGNKVHSFASLV